MEEAKERTKLARLGVETAAMDETIKKNKEHAAELSAENLRVQ